MLYKDNPGENLVDKLEYPRWKSGQKIKYLRRSSGGRTVTITFGEVPMDEQQLPFGEVPMDEYLTVKSPGSYGSAGGLTFKEGPSKTNDLIKGDAMQRPDDDQVARFKKNNNNNNNNEGQINYNLSMKWTTCFTQYQTNTILLNVYDA
ncbi:hypothetical protein C2G38_2207890 [Gigaspora rosea]|uniref:Uncharacterized protein n=1 Tax=Gigaspora rosea TaxID=44941 RepID=A0A397UKW8_9GLOM|nr:hypothetical protein C2G38_2207890 [Gigaspora rosea]